MSKNKIIILILISAWLMFGFTFYKIEKCRELKSEAIKDCQIEINVWVTEKKERGESMSDDALVFIIDYRFKKCLREKGYSE